MNSEEEKEFIDALQGKNHIFVMYGRPISLGKIIFSEWMTREDALKSPFWGLKSPWYLIDRDAYNHLYKEKGNQTLK